jgi:DNA gyrase/topoisomerase IV subunit B
MSKKNTVYEDLEHRAHVLHRSDVYVGDTEVDEVEEYVAQKTDGEFKILKKNIHTSAAIVRIFIEVVSNANDNFERSKKTKTPCTKIEVSIDKDTGLTKVWNDGDVIPIELNSKNEYNHSMVFGRLLTSSNFNDEEDRLTSGRNGMGVKLANIFSKKFVVKSADPNNNKKFTQMWTDNMANTTGPEIEDLSSKPKGFTEVSWIPDFSRFGISGYTDDILSQYTRFVLDIAMLCPKVNVFLNGDRLECNSLKQYATLYAAPTNEILLVHKAPGIEVLVTTASQAESVSFINGVFTRDGGGHVDAWTQIIFKPLRDAVNALDPNKPKIKITDITRYFRIFVVGTAVRPRFSNQEKHLMTYPKAKDFSTTVLKSTYLKTLMKWSVIDDIKFDIENKVNKQLKQSEGKKRTFVNVPNLTPANKAGGKESNHCTLILCEGKSAKSYVMAGMEKGVYGRSGRDWFGVYPLRGKIKNCQDLPRSQICKIENVDDIIKALGLQHDADYSKDSAYNTLRYGRVMIMTDADVDGIHIEGLIINLFLCLFPTLFDRPESYIVSMKTPIVRISGPKIKEDILLFDERRYKDYALQHERSTYKPQYYKGLGSSSIEEVSDTFGVKMVHYTKDEKTSESIHRMFNKKRADARKLFLDSYDPSNGISLDDEPEIVMMAITDFVDNEMPKHSMANNERMIPNLIDGLKTSQRKILFGAKLKKLKNKGDPIKVAQFGAYVSEHTSYHHGEESLFGAIGNMASEFVGSNNIPLFTRNGQFGCLDPDTLVLMWDSTQKRAEDVVVGDQLVGDDGRVRNVTEVTSGTDEMYEISRNNSLNKLGSYIVNSHHILTLAFSSHKSIRWKRKSARWSFEYVDTVNGTFHSKSVLVTSDCSRSEAFDKLEKLARDIPCSNVFDIDVQSYLRLPNHVKHHLKGLTNHCAIQWDPVQTAIDPYIMGAWLGDGSQDDHAFASSDPEVIKAWALWLDTVGCEVVHCENSTYYIRPRGSGSGPAIGDPDYGSASCKGCQTSMNTLSVCDWKFDKCTEPYIVSGVTRTGVTRTDLNPFIELESLYKNKHLPTPYILTSETSRLELLAGLIDTDGTLRRQGACCSFEISQCATTHRRIIEGARLVADSLGFQTSINDSRGMLSLYIAGDVVRIPTRIPRKQATENLGTRTPHHHAITVQHLRTGKFNGWSIDGNERFLLADFTVTHNTRVKGGKDIAKPRYIRTKMDYLTQFIFPDSDDPLLDYLVDDGQDIEPRFYVPIIPMVLVNGGEGIGTGHACNVPAYNPVELVQAVKTWLDNDGEVLFEDPDSGDEVSLFPELHPWYRGFTGRIEKHGTQYNSYGVCERGAKPNLAIVSELPIGMWTETFEIQLNEMQQGADKTIQSVSDHNTVKKVWVEITELPDGLSCSVESLKLKQNIKVNMTLWGSDRKIHKYKTVDHIIDEFCRIRFDYYGKRRRSLIDTLEAEIRLLGNKERFVREVVDNDLPLMKQKESVVVQHLIDRAYDPSPETAGHGYGYLLRMQVSSLTEEKIKQLQNDIQSNQTKLDAIRACNEKQMWTNDLDQFLKEYDIWLKMMAKEVATKPKVEKKIKKTNTK